MAEETNTTQDSAGKDYELVEVEMQNKRIVSVIVIKDSYYVRLFLKKDIHIENRSPDIKQIGNLSRVRLSLKHMITFFPNKVEIYRC